MEKTKTKCNLKLKQYNHQKQPPECSAKKVFLKNSQNIQENTCAGAFFQ